jgi:ribonuclease D
MEDDDNDDNEDGINKNDIIKFVDVNSIEEKNKYLEKNTKNQEFIFFTIAFKPERTTDLTYIDTKEKLDEFINLISSSYNEIAVDLEHHSKESYLGLTCLIQISTRDSDYILDAIKLRSVLNNLNVIFTNPNILKVFHGADYDILWLQRDFGVYVVNMFDTGRASRILSYESYSLKYLLHKFCDFEADKTYQLADWRIRPLTEGMIKYARNDTHFLLYIYDELKKNLILKSAEDGGGAQGIFMYYKLCIKQSSEICLQSYQKPQVKDKTYYQYSQMNANKSKRELGIIKEVSLEEKKEGNITDPSSFKKERDFVINDEIIIQPQKTFSKKNEDDKLYNFAKDFVNRDQNILNKKNPQIKDIDGFAEDIIEEPKFKKDIKTSENMNNFIERNIEDIKDLDKKSQGELLNMVKDTLDKINKINDKGNVARFYFETMDKAIDFKMIENDEKMIRDAYNKKGQLKRTRTNSSKAKEVIEQTQKEIEGSDI